MKEKILIAGSARSGTRYMSELLQAHGLDVLHEKDGKNGTSDWREVAKDDLKKYDKIVHIVRFPLNAISSIQTLNNESWGMIRKTLGLKKTKNFTFLCMAYWYSWNLRIDKMTKRIIRLEELNDNQELLFYHFGIIADERKFNGVPRDTNTRKGKYKPLGWKDLHKAHPDLCTSIMRLSINYGYGVYL